MRLSHALVGRGRVVFLGTGDAFSSGGRASMSILIDAQPRMLLDCSPHTVYSLRRLGYTPADVQYLLVTHLHGDHAGGIPYLILSLLYKEKGTIVASGPPGLEQFAYTTFRQFFDASDPRSVFIVREPGAEFPFRVTRREARHAVPGYMYRLEVNDKVIVYTGDTGPLDLRGFADGADYLIHEAAELDEKSAALHGHSTPWQAAQVAKECGVKQLVLVHTPELDRLTVKRVREVFPRVEIPKDFDWFRL